MEKRILTRDDFIKLKEHLDSLPIPSRDYSVINKKIFLIKFARSLNMISRLRKKYYKASLKPFTKAF